MIRLYGSPLSRAFRCIWMLEEMGLEYESVPTAWTGDENRTPEFLAINPNGKVPAIVVDDVIVWESLAINLYLARRFGGAMAPGSDAEAARAYRWSLWAMGEFEGPVDAVARFDAKLPDAWATQALAVLDSSLEGGGWLAGEAFGVADLNVAVMFQRPLLAAIDRRPFGHVHRWLEACRSRPAFARMLEIGRAAQP